MEPIKEQGLSAALFGGLRSKDARAKLILVLGLLGMALILFSSFSQGKKKETPLPTQTMSNQQYTVYLEKRLLDLVSSIEGVGKVEVMVTLETGVEYIYAQEEKRNTDLSRDYDGEQTKKVTEKDVSQSSYILIEQGGEKQALVEQTKEPVVKGVVIICQGAGNSVVEARIVGAVSTALNIPTTHIFVTKITN